MSSSNGGAPRPVALLQRAHAYVAPALGRRLARAGYDLVLHQPREGLVDEVAALGAAVEVVTEAEVPHVGPGSDGTPEGMQRLVRRALDRFGRLDSAALHPPSGSDRQYVQGLLLDSSGADLQSQTGYLEA